MRRAGGAASSDDCIRAFDRELRSGVFPIVVDPEAVARMAAAAPAAAQMRTARGLPESLRGASWSSGRTGSVQRRAHQAASASTRRDVYRICTPSD